MGTLVVVEYEVDRSEADRIVRRGTAPGELFRPMSHLALEGEAQGLCGTRVEDEVTELPHGAACVVCSDLGLAFLTWHPAGLSW